MTLKSNAWEKSNHRNTSRTYIKEWELKHDHKNHQLGIDAYILELADKWKYNSTMFKNVKKRPNGILRN